MSVMFYVLKGQCQLCWEDFYSVWGRLYVLSGVEFQMSFKPLKLHKENENKQIVSHDFMSVTELKLNKQLFLLQCSDV